jgi:hypothetical protein
MVVRFLKYNFSDNVDVNRHLLTGLGVHYYIQYLVYLRVCLEGNREQFNFVWEYGFMPRIDRKVLKKGNGVMNGTTHSSGLKTE